MEQSRKSNNLAKRERLPLISAGLENDGGRVFVLAALSVGEKLGGLVAALPGVAAGAAGGCGAVRASEPSVGRCAGRSCLLCLLQPASSKDLCFNCSAATKRQLPLWRRCGVRFSHWALQIESLRNHNIVSALFPSEIQFQHPALPRCELLLLVGNSPPPPFRQCSFWGIGGAFLVDALFRPSLGRQKAVAHKAKRLKQMVPDRIRPMALDDAADRCGQLCRPEAIAKEALFTCRLLCLSFPEPPVTNFTDTSRPAVVAR